MSEGSVTERFEVRGMTCGHCVKAVTDELAAVPGVRAVEVDLDDGVASVISDDGVDTERVRAAVDEAGYELVR
jgi:copper chaperone